MSADLTPAAAGVICPNHGKVDLTRADYMRQLSNPNAFWKCPLCGDSCDFDDDRYEEINFPEDSNLYMEV